MQNNDSSFVNNSILNNNQNDTNLPPTTEQLVDMIVEGKEEAKLTEFEKERNKLKQEFNNLNNKHLFKKFLDAKNETVSEKLKKIELLKEIDNNISNIENNVLREKIEELVWNIEKIEELDKNVKNIKKWEELFSKIWNNVTQAKILYKQLANWETSNIKKVLQLKELSSKIWAKESELFWFDLASVNSLIEEKIEIYKKENQDLQEIIKEKKSILRTKEEIEPQIRERENTLSSMKLKMDTETEEERIQRLKIERELEKFYNQDSELEERLKVNNAELVERNLDLQNFTKNYRELIKPIDNNISNEQEVRIEKISNSNVWKFIIEAIKKDREIQEEEYTRKTFENIAIKMNTGDTLSKREKVIYSWNKEFIDNIKIQEEFGWEKSKEDEVAKIKYWIEKIALDWQQEILNIWEQVKEGITAAKSEVEKKVSMLDVSIENEDFYKKLLLEKKGKYVLTEEDKLRKEKILNENPQAFDWLFDKKTLTEKISEGLEHSITRNEQKAEKNFTILKDIMDEQALKAKVEELENQKEMSFEENMLIQNSDKNLFKKVANKKILLTSSNLGTTIDEINKELKQETLKWDKKDVYKIKNLETKKRGYLDLKAKLDDVTISEAEKEWLILMLSSWDWLKDYIKHRSENLHMNIDYVNEQLEKSKNVNYASLWDDYYYDLYSKSVDEQKYSIIEDFARIKKTIPWFENVNLNDDLIAETKKLWITDEDSQRKIQKLVDLQENIKNFSLNTYTESFLSNVYNKNRGIESQIIALDNEKKANLHQIDKMNISEFEKERMKELHLKEYDRKMQELLQSRNKIKQEISKIENYWYENWRFTNNDLQAFDKNLKLVSIVSDYWNYWNIISWIHEDIIAWKTNFSAFQTMSELNWDIYTYEKVKDVLNKHINILDNSIEILGNSTLIDDKRKRTQLILKKQEKLALLDKVNKKILLEEDVNKILSFENLKEIEYEEYLLWLHTKKQEINNDSTLQLADKTLKLEEIDALLNKDVSTFLEEITDIDNKIEKKKIEIASALTIDEKAKLEAELNVLMNNREEIKNSLMLRSKDYAEFKNINKKYIKYLKEKLNYAKPEDIPFLEAELKEAEELEQNYKLKLLSQNNIDLHTLQAELWDWFSISEKKTTIKEEVVETWKKVKRLWRLFFWNTDVDLEHKNARIARHNEIERVLDSLINGWITGTIKWIYKSSKFITDSIANIWVHIQQFREVLERNRVTIFWFILVTVFIIVSFSDMTSYNLIDVNTSLFSVWEYSRDANWLIKFIGDNPEKEMNWLASIYYKWNILLLFMYFVVLYQIAIEFVYRYLDLLKNTTQWIEAFVIRAFKILFLVFLLWLVFKINSWIVI